MSRRAAMAAAAALLALAGCQGMYDAANTKALTSDIGDLLGIAGAMNPQLDCRILGGTRTGFCTVPIEPLVLRVFVKSLKPRESPAAPEEWQVEGSCGSVETWAAGSGARIYVSKRRAPELRLRGGASFEYLLLYTAADGWSCLQVSYAYS